VGAIAGISANLRRRRHPSPTQTVPGKPEEAGRAAMMIAFEA